MLKKIAPLALAFVAINAQADTLGVQAGVSYWSPSFSGNLDSGSSTVGNVSLKKDLGLSDTSATGLYVAIEHPVPLFPNFRIERTNLSETASSTVSRNIEFEGQTFTSGTNVKTAVDLTHTDWTGYYEILDGMGGISADLGLTIRQFDGEIEIASTASNGAETLDVPVPLLYGRGEFEIPGLPFPVAVGGMINYLGFGDTSISDTRFFVSAKAPLPVEVGGEIGYRSFSVELEDTADLSVSGVYASATVNF